MVKLTYQLIMMMNEVLILKQAAAICNFVCFDGSQITFNIAGHPLNQFHEHRSRWFGKCLFHAYVLKHVLNYFGNCFLLV